MLNRSASLAMSTSFVKALPGALDIKRHSPSILNISASLTVSTSVLKALPGKLDIKKTHLVFYIYGAYYGLWLTLCMLGNFCMLFCHLLEFFSRLTLLCERIP